MKFASRLPLQILALDGRPRSPDPPGFARRVTADDAALFADWRLAFGTEAVPEEPPSTHQAQAKIAANGDHLMWIVDGAPVSLASIGRRTRNGAVINGVYTPPAFRGRGYAGAVVSAVVQKGYAEGKSFACLYVDRRNPASNRCYAKLGFTPVCEAWHCVRA
jgi:predicted GNAT family acetyltransferase